MNEPVIASPEMRQAHSRALRKLQKWKLDYQEVSNAIRATKQILRHYSEDRYAQLALRGLRGDAHELMMYRFNIKQALRATAYRYASREAVEAARKVA
jgi:hypothetical protein